MRFVLLAALFSAIDIDLVENLIVEGWFGWSFSGAAFGAARLGLIAATGADPLAVCTAPATAETVEPDAGLTEAYADAYQRFRALYPAIRGAM